MPRKWLVSPPHLGPQLFYRKNYAFVKHPLKSHFARECYSRINSLFLFLTQSQELRHSREEACQTTWPRHAGWLLNLKTANELKHLS
jgi:hypothetical protein